MANGPLDIEKADVAALEQIIRSYVNLPHRHAVLMADEPNFNRLCSAMDCIGDVEVGLSSYEEMEELGSAGDCYITIYGVLQLLYVQQDAVDALSAALGFTSEKPLEVKLVRELRNKAVGHPTRTRNGASHFISRSEMAVGGFRLMSRFPDGRTEFMTVNLAELVKDQRQAVAKILREIVLHLRSDELSHRTKYRVIKLADIFAATVSYHASKVLEASLPTGDKALGAVNLATIERSLYRLCEALVERGLSRVVADFVDELKYPIAQLHAYFSAADQPRINSQDAKIFSAHLAKGLDEIRTIALEIDSEYESTVLPA